MKKSTIFISSVQKELQPERRAIKDYVQGDPLLRRFFEVFLFEDLPASDRMAWMKLMAAPSMSDYSETSMASRMPRGIRLSSVSLIGPPRRERHA